ncbi:MAG TPA: M20/M25/M40 family metallo-hydrolase [Gaiellaceae bacterium]|nr:M20/M25/M40 family metallo-hydrolase [Gaiellaceae bacterium]
MTAKGASVVELAEALVRIDSVNPDLVPGGAGEEEIARFVAEWLEHAGLEVEMAEAAPGRFNVVGIARGSGGGRSLLLNAHMDTVGAAGMEDGWKPRVDGGRLYGRGAYDMKASLAAIMLAGAEAAKAALRGDVIVTAVCDEEVASIGSAAIAERYKADAAIVAEPTEERLAVAHKGFAWIEFETLGRAAHGSRPDLGEDAIARMGPVLVALEAYDEALRRRAPHRLLGTGSLHASTIEGGTELSTYPDRCLLRAERRTLPGETEADIAEESRLLLGATNGSARVTFFREPFEVDEDAEIVQVTSRNAGGPEVIGVPFWADSALLAAAGIPTVVYGPRGEGAHAAIEWVDLASAARCLGVYRAVAAELCA